MHNPVPNEHWRNYTRDSQACPIRPAVTEAHCKLLPAAPMVKNTQGMRSTQPGDKLFATLLLTENMDRAVHNHGI